jgi:hypothetical protein
MAGEKKETSAIQLKFLLLKAGCNKRNREKSWRIAREKAMSTSWRPRPYLVHDGLVIGLHHVRIVQIVVDHNPDLALLRQGRLCHEVSRNCWNRAMTTGTGLEGRVRRDMDCIKLLGNRYPRHTKEITGVKMDELKGFCN